MLKSLPVAALAGVLLQGCAYVNVTPTAGDPDALGFRVYAPKTLLVVNGSSVSSVVVPDCSKEYAVTFGSFLAKNDLILDINNGMVSKIDSKQDTTALPIKLVDAVTEVAKAGKSLGEAFSDKAAGGTADRFGVFEFSCENGALVSGSALTERDLLHIPTTRPNAPPPISNDAEGDQRIPD